ncbi:hypothetical protein CPB83DRAFT_873879 [Crepidotus variabilis]|uniref:TOG domain-containing protein n=1 Tax=Crepidotus variabilis TaxID=179855 RepID=A0A9P6EQB5_9AGAR|nr:hypothetical protein CPB83DRAFT_873879 [Crepidotus variabilis]
MEDAPPPTDHTLRPHHITLLIVLSAAFKDSVIQKLPKPFALHVYRVLLNEISEVAHPTPHKELLEDFCTGPSANEPASKAFIEDICSKPLELTTADRMGDFLSGTQILYDGTKDEIPKLQRRSLFGFFCRRCRVSFLKLSAPGLLKLCQDYGAWRAGDASAGYFIPEKDELHSDLLLWRTLADKKTWARPHHYEKWQQSFATGDEKTAVENLRRFFEQHFHESSDSGYRHHALLELIRLHYIKGEYVAARQLLTEAIDAARTGGDKLTLHHCLSILHRIPSETPGQKPSLQEIQSDLHPLEVLYDTFKLLDEDNEQPLSAAFRKIYQSIGLYDYWLDISMASLVDLQQMSHHAVQAIVWREAGCGKLATLEENIVLAFTEFGSDNSTRLTVILNRAYSTARDGHYEDALAFLLHQSVWQGLTTHDYALWSAQIWHILALRATRRGQFRLYREFLLPQRPNGLFNEKQYLYDNDGDRMSPIRESLYQLLQLRERDQSTSGIDHLLKALWHSEFLCRFGLYRTAVILLADIGLEFGMSKRSQQILEEIMPQIIQDTDLELRAVAAMTMARCIMATGGIAVDSLKEAVSWIQMAESDFEALEIWTSVKDAQYLMSIVYHNMGLFPERDDAASRHTQTEKCQKKLEATTFDQSLQDVLEVVAKEEDFTTLPISERLAHKNWKARVSGYESLIKTFENTASDTDPAFKPYINHSDTLKKIVTDANAVAQEKGVECVAALVKFAGETAVKTREVVIPALVDKCLGSARAGTKNQAVELILQYVEVENGGAGVVTDVLVGLAAKQPKAVAGSVLVLKEIIRLFGAQAVPSPPILKALPKIFAHSDKTVRAEGTNLTLALYQYLGPGLESWLGDLKPVQVKELKDAFENLEKEGKGHKTLKPERMTRAHAREVAAQSEEPDGGVDEEPEDLAAPDPRQFAEAVDIVSQLSPSLQTDLKSSKWKERKEALDNLSTLLANTPKIKEAAELGELARSLATCIAKDANINCVMVAAKCLEDMAKGMMAHFARYREAVVPLMLERLKERKANVTDAIGVALDAVFLTTSINDILPDMDASLKSKNPQVKEGALKFLTRCFAAAKTPIQPNQIKPLAETLATLNDDGFEGARNEAANCLGHLMKMVGERPLNATMDGLADNRKAKVKEAFENATVKCKAGGPAPPPKAAAPPAKKGAPSKSKAPPPQEEEAPPPPKAAPKPKAPAKKPATAPAASAPKKTPAGAPAKPGGKSAASALGANLDAVKFKHHPEEADALAAELIPANILTDLADANWKTRLAALEELSTWLEGQIDTLDAEVLVRALAKKGWSEKNFQVSAKIYGVLTLLSQQCPSFGRSCIALSVPHLTEKLGDLKLKKPAGDTLLAFGEKTSLQFVLGQAYEPLSNQKAPKVLSDAIAWINTALTEFGITGLSLRTLIDFLKTGLQNSNAAVRTSATKTMVTVKLFAGSSIKSLIEDLNPQLLNTVNAEFDKVEGQSPPEPTRTSADLENMAADTGPATNAGGGSDPLDDLFPRVELDSLMKGTTILADAKADAWKVKKEALESLQSILDQGSNQRLKSSMGEVGQTLKARVTDTNKAVQSLALDIVGRIATGMGKPFEKHTRLFALPVSTVLSDQKAPIRSAALQTLTAIATACETLDSMIPGFTTALETQNPLQKATLLQWMVDWFKEHPPSSLDIKAWVPLIVSSLDDRSVDVRKGAQGLLPTLIQFSGFDYVMNQTSSLKPASRASAIPLIQAARPAASETATPAPTKPISKTAAPPSKASSPSPEPVAETTHAEVKPKLTGVRRKIPLGTSRPESRAESVDMSAKPTTLGMKKPGGSTKPSTASTPVNPALPFTNMNIESKKARTNKDATRWINEGGATRKDLADLLQSQMEPHTNKDLLARLFSHDHNAVNDHIGGLNTLAEFYTTALDSDENVEKLCLASLDYPLKYVSIKIHEPQPNLISKCLDLVEAVVSFLRQINYQLTDGEATCFIPTIVHKLGDPREPVRVRVQQIIRILPTVYAYSRVFQILLEQGLKAKAAKTRQGTLDELSGILKKSGMGASESPKAFQQIASLISDKDPAVRKSALGTLGEVYTLVGEKVWSLVGTLSPKDKTQLEERLRRVPGPSNQSKAEPSGIAAAPAIARLTNVARPGSPSMMSRLARPASPAMPARSTSPAPPPARSESPIRPPTQAPIPASSIPTSPPQARPRSLLPSRLGRPRTNLVPPSIHHPSVEEPPISPITDAQDHAPVPGSPRMPGASSTFDEPPRSVHSTRSQDGSEEITVTISSILSSDPSRSVDALKKIQKILSVGPEKGPAEPQYRELAEHTEGLIETITLQMAHIFEHPNDLVLEENFRLAKHLIQTLNNFCDHSFLAESLTVDILTALLEELTLRLLETDDSPVKKVKDLSRFINMIILRLFATGRRMSIFRSLFALLLRIVKPFPSNGTLTDSKEAKVAELVLKCVWKLARNIPQDLSEAQLDPVELFPAIESFLQSVPPNEWRARATNKVPCGDMPLRTIKVIIQHIVAHYGDEVYELLSASFDDPSATIVYPYVYRILNSNAKAANGGEEPQSRRNGNGVDHQPRTASPSSSRPLSPQETASVHSQNRPASHTSSNSAQGQTPYSPQAEEPDPDAQLLVIIGHISSETTGALHKEGITELHHFLKAYPHKRPRVEKLLESTGAAFRKYINRALATRAAEDQERNIAVADTLSKLEQTPVKNGTISSNGATGHQERLSRLHDIFQYRSSTASTGSAHGSSQSGPRTSS